MARATKSQIIPPPTPSKSISLTIIGWIPWWFWLLAILYVYVKFGREKKKKVGRSARKRAGKPPLPIPSRSQQVSQQTMRQQASPALARRSSFQRPAGTPLNGNGTPLRRGYGSMRSLNRVASGLNLNAQGGASTGLGSGATKWSYGGAGNDEVTPLSPPLRYGSPTRVASPSRASPQPPPSSYPARQIPRSSSYIGPPGYPLPASPSFSPALPRRRFTEAAPPPVVISHSNQKKRGFVDDYLTMESKKRSRKIVDVDSDTEMELDELREVHDPGFRSRGTKRDDIDDEDEEEDEDVGDRYASKRSRKNPPEVESQSIASSSASPMKRSRTRESDESSGGGDYKKRSRVGRQSKPTSKREIDDVTLDEVEDGDWDEEGERIGNGVRNADSDFGSDEEDEVAVAKQPVRREKKGSKRLRSKVGREETDDYDMMDDVLPSTISPPLASTSTSAPTSAKKRNLPTPKNRQSLAKLVQKRVPTSPIKRTVGTKVGEEWTDLEGERWKIGQDGTQRRLCEVREMRYKYKMPKDSRHPDRHVMHEVLAEKWLTMEEYDAAVADRKLSWQHPVEEIKVEDNGEMKADTDVPVQDAPEDQSGIFFTRGISTPFRTHNNVSRSVSSNSLTRSSSTGTGATSSPKLSVLANGRMRLPSGVGSNQSPRSWSHGRAMRLQEDERRAKEEREKRRIKAMMDEEKVRPKPKEEVKEIAPPLAKELPAVASTSALPSINFGTPASNASKPPAEPKALPPTFFAPSSTVPTSTEDKAKLATPSVTPSVPAAPATKTTKPDFFAPPTSTATAAAAPVAAPKTAFTFGKPPNSTNDDKPSPVPENTETKPPTFTFGASASTPSISGAARPASPAAFSFGAAPATAPPATEAKPAAPAPFSFGAAPKPATATPATAAPLFSFGNATPASTPAASSVPISSKPLSFGAVPSTEAPKPTFTFGTPAAAPAAQPDKAATPFSFGTAAAPTATQPATSSTFSFGAQPTTSTAPAAAPFAFGQQSGAAPTTFGSTPAAASPFSFGAPAPNTSSQAESTPFSFSAPGTAPGAPVFNFGSGAPTSGTTGGGVRNVRRLPSKRA